MVHRKRILIAMLSAISVAAISAGVVSADGSTTCSSSSSFYTVMGEENLSTQADRVSASIEVQPLNRCNGTDPNGKNGVFVYVQLLERYESQASGVQFAYDNPAHPEYYGSYLRFGYYLCSWSGDSACGLGHGYFVSWSRNDANSGCAGSDANGITRLSGVTNGFHDFEIDVQSDGSVQFRRDDALVYTLASSATGCWNRDNNIDEHVRAAAYSTAWDPGDQIGGSVGDTVRTNAFSVNDGTASTTCAFTVVDSYRCSDTGARDIAVWTIDR
jgi:hypothetical protein